MLDDLKYIHMRDAADTLGAASKEYVQLLDDVVVAGTFIDKDIYNLVYVGMGDSAIAAELLRVWPVLPEPLEIVRGYDLPEYVDGDTLVILASHSGDTEEVLSCLEHAEQKGAQIAVIASGGVLWERAEQRDYPRVRLPGIVPPRFAVLAAYRASLSLLARAGVVGEGTLHELAEAAEFLAQAVADWQPTVPTKQNPAKQLALECIGKSVVVYAGPKLYPAAYKWKMAFNENAKQVAWCGRLPEFHYGEFAGWSKQPYDKPYAVIDLRGDYEDPRILKGFELSAKLLSGLRPEPIVVRAAGEGVLRQLLWLLAYGDFVAIYTALLNGLDPMAEEAMKKLRKALASN